MGEFEKMGNPFSDRLAVNATCISNDFLDEYMASANGDYIKVYLYLLRHRTERVQMKDVADALDLTDNDVKRAVQYWEKQGVFSEGASAHTDQELEKEENFKASEAELCALKKSSELRPLPPFGQEDSEEHTEVTEPLPRDEEEFAGILFVAKHVLPVLPNQSHVRVIAYMYDELKMSADLIEFLLEYCTGIDKVMPRYLEATARNWHEQGIRSVHDAKAHLRAFEEKKKAKRSAGSSLKKSSSFLNISGSDVDYDAIARKKMQERNRHGIDKNSV